MNFKTVSLLFFVTSALAICPGFNYGIGNQQVLGDGISRCKFGLLWSLLFPLSSYLRERL